MSFFEPPPPPPEPEDHRQPEWIGPPDNVLGVAVPLELLLARTAEVAVGVTCALAYPNGISFSLSVRRRTARRPHAGPDPFFDHHSHRGGELPADVFRFGFELADGSKVTNVVGFPAFDQTPERVLIQRGGSGGERTWDVEYWLWPLPPSGPLTVVCEWPSEGIELTRVEIDVAPLLDAASRSEALWEDGEASPGMGGGGLNQIF